MDQIDKKIVVSILNYFRDSIRSGKVNEDQVESLEVAMQCISETFETPVDNSQTQAYKTTTISLRDLIQDFMSSGDSRSQIPSRCEEAERFKNEGNLLLQQGKLQQAVEMYTKSIVSDSRNAVYYSNRAAAYNQMGDYEKSIKDCETAISIDPNYSKAYNRLGSAQLALGKFQEAIKTLEEAIKLDPNNETTQNLLKTAKEKTTSSTAPSNTSKSGLGSGLNLESLQPLLEKFGNGGKEGESGISNILNQPGLMDMAQQMIQNHPEMIQQLAGMFGMGNKPRAP